MDADKLAIDVLLKGITEEQQASLLESIKYSVTQAKTIQKQRIGENVNVVIQALRKMEADLRGEYSDVADKLSERITSIKDGQDGHNGSDGRSGKDGRAGRDGLHGKKGEDGLPGADGIDGIDGVSVTDASIDFDGSLVITLSNGRVINVGEVVSQELANNIKVISTMSTNGAVGIKDEGTTVSTGVKNINFVGASVTATASGDDVTVNVSAGTGTVTSVAATAGTGISVTGSPITTTGTLNITNTSPDQVVSLTGAGSTTITGTYPSFTISSSGGVTSVTGTSPVVSSGGTTPAISMPAATTSVSGHLTSTDWNTFNGKGSGTVTSVAQSFTGGLISVSGSPITTSGTLALTVAGTSGGVPYFTTASTWATSAALAANALVLGGGAGAAPATTTTGTGVVTALGVNTGTAGAFVVNGGALGTPSGGTVTNLTGTASININGTVGDTTPAAGAFTTGTFSSTLGVTGVTTLGNGAILGTPASGVLTNATGLPISSGVSGLGTGVATFLATPSSANLAAAVTGETGTGALVFASSPTLTAPVISTITNTGTLTLPTTTGTLSLGLSSKLIAATRDMTLATGSVSYTGVGFRPTCLQAFAANTALSGNNAINGYCDSALGQAALRAGSATPGNYVYLASVLINLGTDGNLQTFAVTSFDADGFTGTWTRTGAPGGTQSIAFIAFK